MSAADLFTPEPSERPTVSEESATASPEPEGLTVSGGDSDILSTSAEMVVTESIDYSSYLDAILASEQRQEQQLEGALSIMLIIVLVGVLNYIYKLFKMFF